MKNLLLLMFAALLSGGVAGQCKVVERNQAKPTWMEGNFPRKHFKRFEARGNSLDNARRKVEEEVARERSQNTGVQTQIGSTGVHSSDELTVKASSIDEYYEICGSGEVRVCRLYQLVDPSSSFTEVEFDDEYSVGLRPLVPALAQFYKGHKFKGTLFLVSELVLLGGGGVAMIAANSSSSSSDQEYQTGQAAYDNQQYSKESRQSAKDLALVLFATAGAVYIWNVIDGYASRPVTRRFRVSVLPTLAPNGQLNAGMAMSLNYNF